MVKMINEEELIQAISTANKQLEEVVTQSSSAVDNSEIIYGIDYLFDLWGTEGGEKSVSYTKKEAEKLESNKLLEEINGLAAEKFTYTKDTKESNIFIGK